MEKLIIDRSIWRTGDTGKYATGLGETRMQNDEGFHCCLGIYCKQLGIGSLLGKETPLEALNKTKEEDKSPILLAKNVITERYDHTMFSKRAMNINDSYYLKREQREIAITKHFKTVGIEVEFQGEYVDYTS